jgi:hypothetical protein
MYFERIPRGMLVGWWISDGGRKHWNRSTVSVNRERMIHFE